jgi:hypothetical protein
MTLKNVINSVGKLDRSCRKPGDIIRKLQPLDKPLPDGDAVATITLADGDWTCWIHHYGYRSDDWAYIIPDDRKQEKRLRELLHLD